MRVLIFHGYLLSGTGSNVYNARLAMALKRLGHEVHLLSQDRHPEEQGFVDAIGEWDEGKLRVRAAGAHTTETHPGAHTTEAHSGAHTTKTHPGAESTGLRGQDAWLKPDVDGASEIEKRKNLPPEEDSLSGGGSCTAYRPEIGVLLPVYVADRYEGVEAKTFADCSNEEIGRYVDANVAAVRELVELVRPEMALANHLVMGPVILARALAGSGVPYAVKIHGSALEYTVKPQPERFLRFAHEGLEQAAGVLVGSHHTAASLWRALEGPGATSFSEGELQQRTRLGPPGVDIERFGPLPTAEAGVALNALLEGLRARVRAQARARARAQHHQKEETPPSAFTRDDNEAVAALEQLHPGQDRLVAFVGKLIVSKGVDLLIAAWPLVLQQIPDAKLLITGFGAYRQTLEQLLDALARGELARAEQIATAGRSLETGVPEDARPLRHLLAFLAELRGGRGRDRDPDSDPDPELELERYLAAARALRERVVFAGRLDHEELAGILPACEAIVVPSTFPEAFGMVAVEGAACGAFPVSAGHSGLGEVSDVLARAVPAEAAGWLSFPVDDRVVRTLAGNLIGWLRADQTLRASAREGLVRTARERWSWEGVARGVIAAAHGELDDLAKP
ncbi:MAG TPA: glycosyltransferase [Solirubrobacteraceae bacterium]|nr:glycosyltransferase [Solirubrobacteraceae bacterium]